MVYNWLANALEPSPDWLSGPHAGHMHPRPCRGKKLHRAPASGRTHVTGVRLALRSAAPPVAPVLTGVRLKVHQTKRECRKSLPCLSPTWCPLPHANLQPLSPDPLYPVWSTPASLSPNDLLFTATTVEPPCRMQSARPAWEHTLCHVPTTLRAALHE